MSDRYQEQAIKDVAAYLDEDPQHVRWAITGAPSEVREEFVYAVEQRAQVLKLTEERDSLKAKVEALEAAITFACDAINGGSALSLANISVAICFMVAAMAKYYSHWMYPIVAVVWVGVMVLGFCSSGAKDKPE